MDGEPASNGGSGSYSAQHLEWTDEIKRIMWWYITIAMENAGCSSGGVATIIRATKSPYV